VVAARAAARAAAGAAAWAAAWDAAQYRLAPTVDALQDSAIELFDHMIDGRAS
jgi:glycine/D-amino acid oxidase-like deaminating enzyme